MGVAWGRVARSSARASGEGVALVGEVNLGTTAVVAEAALNAAETAPRQRQPDSCAAKRIDLVEYRPNYLKYTYTTPEEAVAVFSEIYYDKGWTARIDGVEAPCFRADYVLRAMRLPAGEHTVEWSFRAPAWGLTEGITGLCSGVILLGAVAALIHALRRRKKENAGTEASPAPKTEN